MNINFIKAISPKHRSSVHYWIVFTSILSVTLMILITMLIGTEWHTYSQLMQKCTSHECNGPLYETCMNEYRTLADSLENTDKKLCKLDKYQQSKSPTLSAFEMIVQLAGQPPIQELSIKKKQIIMQIIWPQLDQAIRFIEQLNASPILHNSQLVSLQSKPDSSFIATITSEIK